jgi:hypothetical protein
VSQTKQSPFPNAAAGAKSHSAKKTMPDRSFPEPGDLRTGDNTNDKSFIKSNTNEKSFIKARMIKKVYMISNMISKVSA